MIRQVEKSKAEIAELFNVDRSTISRMVKETQRQNSFRGKRICRAYGKG